jgi:AcrR family transcriptional regulator
MSSRVSYVKSGRVRQKTRTLEAMVIASRQLMTEGVTPTVEQAAARAGVSRATAYRYFPNQRDLLIASYPIIERPSLLPANATEDVAERVATVARAIMQSVVENEIALRAQLRLSLEDAATRPETPLRKGRRLRWFEDALAPLRTKLAPAAFRRLCLALAALVSLEVLIWLVDLGGLSREDAVEQIVWTALQVVNSTRQRGR